MARKWSRQYRAKYSIRWIEKTADEMLEWIKTDGNLFFKQFASEKYLRPSTLASFQKRSEYFKYIYELVKQFQESKLVSLGIQGKSNAFIIFMLKNCAGYKDNPEDPNALNETELQKLRDIIKQETEKQI